jgi:hypothetical protein
VTTPWIVAYGVLAATTIFLGLIVIGILRRVVPILDRHSEGGLDFGGLGVMARVPSIELDDRQGRSIEFTAAIQEPTIVLLMESMCGPCRQLSAALRRTDGHVDGIPIIAVLEDSDEARAFPVPDSIETLYGDRAVVSSAFATAATPYAFTIDEGGVVLERRIANDFDDLKLMARHQKGGDEDPVPRKLLAPTGGGR